MSDTSSPNESESPPVSSGESVTTSAETPRRSFLVEIAAGAVGVIVGIVPAIIGTLFFFDPLVRKKDKAKGDGFQKLTTLDELAKAEGNPVKFPISQDVVDAWNKFRDQPVGAVYVQAGEEKPIAFNATCPHLGCTVNTTVQNDEMTYYCPCHESSFQLNGERINKIPPRGLDELEVEIRNGDEVWVKFQKFQAGKAEKTPIS